MVADISKYKSHPDKKLTVHTEGVLGRTKQLTTLKIAEIAAIFHDLGKLNPNFQDKLDPNKTSKGYAHHAYLSAYAFLCYCISNSLFMKKQFEGKVESIIKIITGIIAHHHGNLTNFTLILKKDECDNLIENFISQKPQLPYSDFIKCFKTSLGEINGFDVIPHEGFQNEFIRIGISNISNPLDYFLETQFAFSSLIQADKTDAGDLELENDKKIVQELCTIYNQKLSDYSNTLQANSELNRLRTQIRIEAIAKIETLLKTTKQRVFALTASTGSGKTLVLLSLAGKIIKEKGNFRIIYSIPFLSITEQVEKECVKIFGSEFIHRIDSKSENLEFQKLQKEIETNPEKAKDIITAKFIEDIFLSPFIITTFVRFFETLVSNVNSTLLKLPSFAKCIFLIDEIQSLPPRLYTFFVAYLSAFCERFDSYCIVSTATMPHFEIKDENAQKLFKEYKQPNELLSFDYFNHKLFNRYEIRQQTEIIETDQLAEMLLSENQSILIILNTIDDTKDLYKILSEHLKNDELVLLNTHFTPNDRKYKIDYAKLRLQHKKKIVLISTQLIEAGVDIDFPTVYRDMATIPSIIQSAGRCNRNGQLENIGKVIVFNLSKNGKLRAELIYRGRECKLLRDTKERVFTKDIYEEKELFDTQKAFFKILSEELVFSEHVQKKPEAKINFVDNINQLAFETIGKFRLIDEDLYGEEFRCYVPIQENDTAFEKLIQLNEILKKAIDVPKKDKDFKKIITAKFAIEEHLKKMSNQIIQVRLKDVNSRPLTLRSYNDLHLIDIKSYSNEIGILLGAENQII